MYLVGDQQERWKECWLDYVFADIVCKLMESFVYNSGNYMMIPFLLAENPQMNRKEAFEKSRQMMKGNKWAAFVLDLSFIGWSLLGIITFGLVNIFFAGPYQYLTQSQLYFRLKEQQKEESYGY